MKILAAIKEKFRYHRKYHKANFTWIEEDMETIVNSAMKSIALNPESGLCEQVLSGTYSFILTAPTPYFFDKAQTASIQPLFHYHFGYNVSVFSNDLFNYASDFHFYAGENDTAEREDVQNNDIGFAVYLDYNGSEIPVIEYTMAPPQNGFPLVLKSFLRYGQMYFSIENNDSDYAYLTCAYYQHIYDNTTLQVL